MTIYFERKSDEQMAVRLANYWKKHNLITGAKQDLQLTVKENRIIVKLIATDPKSVKTMSAKERFMLLELQRELSDSVFEGKETELWICDNQFEQIYDLNQ